MPDIDTGVGGNAKSRAEVDITLEVLQAICYYVNVLGITGKEFAMEENSVSVFKSYLRRLLQDLKDLKEALKEKEYEKAEKMVDKLIDDTQSGIEDN